MNAQSRETRDASRTSVVIAAAGEGRRFGGGVRKPYLLLNDKPILLHSVAAFVKVEAVFEIILVVHPDDEKIVKERWGGELRSMKVKQVAIGGDTRQESVMRGILLSDESAHLVAIHDAVRPLVRPALIRQTIQTAARTGAAMLAAPVKATIKRAGPDLIVTETIPRHHLWAAQTPQIFQRDLILRAYQEAEREGFTATDDAQLLERIGHKVAIVESTDGNIKITTPEDLLVARALSAHLKD